MDCTHCTKYAGNLIDHRGLCRLFGPLNKLERCKHFTERISDKNTKKKNFCHTCIRFTPEEGPEPQENRLRRNGFCSWYPMGIFNGCTRKACLKYEHPN